jgi:hypothetical protein
MMSLRVVGLAWLFFFWAVVSSVDAGDADRAAVPLRAWDGIVSATLFTDIADFERDIRQEAGERVYAFLALDGAGGLALSVAVAIAPAGSRLPPADWQTAVAAADPATRARDFPKIGARARVEAPRFSPDGALSGVIFATGDGFFDVAVSVFEGSGSAVRPPLTAEDAARRIAAAYDATRK